MDIIVVDVGDSWQTKEGGRLSATKHDLDQELGWLDGKTWDGGEQIIGNETDRGRRDAQRAL